MPTTKRDLQAIAYLVKRLREDTPGAGEWHDAGLWPVLAKLEGHNLLITLERVVRHAADPEARTPASIERPFTPAAAAPPVARPPKPDGCCKRCGRAMHEADTACEEPTRRPTPRTVNVTPEVQHLRHLAQIRAGREGENR